MSGRKKFRVMDHELVPKHEIVKPEEAVRILKELGIRPENLPWIRTSDPAAKEIGAKPGDIIRSERRSTTKGKIIVYRFVVAG